MSAENVWYSDRLWAQATRAILTPLSFTYRGIIALRNFGYDLGLLQSVASQVPVLSVGNISVGGTGKTPISAYFVQLLRSRGYQPAIVMRGYGNDEPRVHAVLTDNVSVYTDPDRVAGIAKAIEHGANAIVLDDAFQHRRAERDMDVVLVSAERWSQSLVLPAGPLREPRRSLRRASLIMVTHKSATPENVHEVVQQISEIAPHVPVATAHLSLDELVAVETLVETLVDPTETRADAETHGAEPIRIALDDLAGTSVLAIAGIGDSKSFFAQIRAIGAIVDVRSFPDHHAYSADDVAKLVSEANDHKYVVTTLKDAVKLTSLWAPKGPRLWYVSQAVRVTGGESLVDATVNNFFPFR